MLKELKNWILNVARDFVNGTTAGAGEHVPRVRNGRLPDHAGGAVKEPSHDLLAG